MFRYACSVKKLHIALLSNRWLQNPPAKSTGANDYIKFSFEMFYHPNVP